MVDFFDENKDPQGSTTPTLTEVFKQALDSFAAEMRVSAPAEVVRYDHKKQLVDVRPYHKKKYRDGKTADAPIIYNVPVAFPRAGEAFISLPIGVGHTVMLVFSDRSLEKWLSSGASGEPDDTRKHHVSDAVAIPGGYPFSNTAKVSNAKDLIVKNKNLEMRIRKDGKMQVINQKTEMLKTVLDYMNKALSGNHWGAARARDKFKTFVKS